MTDKPSKKNIDATRKAAAEQEAKAVAENSALPKVSAAEIEKAQKQGILDAKAEAAGDTYQALTDGNLPGAPPARQWHGKDDIMQYEPLLRLGIDEFKDRIAEGEEGAPGVPEEKVAGLLELERSGQNRTDYVKAMCERLDVESPYEVTSAGPGYTNDVTPVTKL